MKSLISLLNPHSTQHLIRPGDSFLLQPSPPFLFFTLGFRQSPLFFSEVDDSPSPTTNSNASPGVFNNANRSVHFRFDASRFCLVSLCRDDVGSSCKWWDGFFAPCQPRRVQLASLTHLSREYFARSFLVFMPIRSPVLLLASGVFHRHLHFLRSQ